jgi:hypothetical protein
MDVGSGVMDAVGGGGVVVVGVQLGVEAVAESSTAWVAAAAVVPAKPALNRPVSTAAAAPSTWVSRRTARRPD